MRTIPFMVGEQVQMEQEPFHQSADGAQSIPMVPRGAPDDGRPCRIANLIIWSFGYLLID